MSQNEFTALFNVVVNFKHKVMLMVLYAGGLRLFEMLNLRVTDIDRKRMQIRIKQGDGRKDRAVMLSEELLNIPRQY